MYIVIKDKANNIYRKSLLDEIKAHLKDIDSDSLPDECLSEIQCNSLLIENDEPIITFDTDQSSLKGEINTDGNIWYNSNGGLITISAYDPIVNSTCSGLKEMIIEDYDESDTVRTIDTPDFNSNQFAINNFSYQIDTLQLCNGFHNFVVTAVDNAGNKKIDNKIIYVDKTTPKASVTVETPDSVLIDDNFWFDHKENITFRVNAISEVSELENITLKINDVNFNFSKDHIQKDENGYYIQVDTKDISYDDRHTYNVSGTVRSVAQNSADIVPFTAYVDCENPVINSFTVEKKNTALDKVLNILSFGIFSNDSLVFKAYVSDTDFDSGIDYVTMWHNKIIEPIKMCKVSDGVYSAVLSAGTEVFQSNIVIKVYDKFGKVNISLPDAENTEPEGNVPNNVFAMIEKFKPIVMINKPDGDGVKRTDSQIWYNSNKPITVKVQDADSGIRSVDVKVNGVNIYTDKNDLIIPQISTTEDVGEKDTQEHIYVFDTDYFNSKVEKPSDGKYVISVKAVDNAGNVCTLDNETYYIDDVPPNVSKFEFNPVTSDNISETSEYIEVLEYGLFFKTEFIADVVVKDDEPTSGLDRLEYSLITYADGKPTDKKTGVKEISNGMASFKIPEGFKGQISVKVYDKAGNSPGDITPQAFVVDEEPPQIDIGTVGDSGYYDSNGIKIFTSDVNMTVTVRDEKSGIREIGYSQSSEKNGFSRKTVTVSNTGNSVDNDLGDGWIITDMDSNLVTEVTKTFTFSGDNNDIVMFFDASDCSGNVNDSGVSEQFIIDTIDPVINVECSSGINGTPYYNADNKAVITVTVTERNFSAELIDTVINNNYGNIIPPVNFEYVDNETYRAVITFPEGDFTFSIKGTDLGGHTAEVILPENGIGVLYVDETPPVVEENFKDFSTPQNGNYFNRKKTAVIKVTEHNFRPDLIGLKILKKDAGLGHSPEEFDDVTYLTVSDSDWVSKGDVHTLKVNFDTDAIYSIEISPMDPSGNRSEHKMSEIFEIDTTLPVVISKNGNAIEGNKNATEFLDIYPYSRKDETEQNVKFMDVNLDYIRYSLTVYTPEYAKGRELAAVSPAKVYLEEDKSKSGKIKGDLFTLPNFSKDGVYALELVAVDKAGNESILNKNTYMRIVESDVLAYIPNSNLEKNTGWYSFQYENGDSISKRPDNFSDIDIVVLAKKGSKVNVVLRDYNGEEINTNIIPTVDETMYGVNIYRYVLKADYFRENFRNDTDAELYLSVKNDGKRIDLGKIHIDNIVPSCIIPQELKSWHWFFGNDTRKFDITGISELLDESECNVYDNGEKIKFLYSAENNSLTFLLEKGWHNVGVELVDIAGNSYNIQEIKNIHIGIFWLIVIIVTLCLFTGAVVLVLYKVRKKRRKAVEEAA